MENETRRAERSPRRSEAQRAEAFDYQLKWKIGNKWLGAQHRTITFAGDSQHQIDFRLFPVKLILFNVLGDYGEVELGLQKIFSVKLGFRLG